MNELDRFITSQENDYYIALSEIKNGKKTSHWMWYIFPQIKGLGQSSVAMYFEIKDLEEAKAYLCDEILGARLLEISNELLKLTTDNPKEIFGEVDAMKLKSSMTLFDYVSDSVDTFEKVLKKYYNGQKDIRTVEICNRMQNKN